ncbi:hypothetical protein EVAR_75685_1 [Eumeta japonica]|uniref:Uncharacterized protein n=1 Tax=Eumeta variegata TaxID=151549 RepID=A0A4C1W414_EUMVA|nr:hypothetical protein EVAR_75685_1 [Eumeta japonica]
MVSSKGARTAAATTHRVIVEADYVETGAVSGSCKQFSSPVKTSSFMGIYDEEERSSAERLVACCTTLLYVVGERLKIMFLQIKVENLLGDKNETRTRLIRADRGEMRGPHEPPAIHPRRR